MTVMVLLLFVVLYEEPDFPVVATTAEESYNAWMAAPGQRDNENIKSNLVQRVQWMLS